MKPIKRKAPSTAFKPGQSGNPGGRPKEVAHVKELAKTYTAEAITTLAKVMRDSSAPHSARVKASESLLDRAWGKAEATLNVSTTDNVRDLSTAEILAALATIGVAGAEAGADGDQAFH
jgi:Family of unknown function (DUF5681)